MGVREREDEWKLYGRWCGSPRPAGSLGAGGVRWGYDILATTCRDGGEVGWESGVTLTLEPISLAPPVTQTSSPLCDSKTRRWECVKV